MRHGTWSAEDVNPRRPMRTARAGEGLVAVRHSASGENVSRATRQGYPLAAAEGYELLFERTMFFTGESRIAWPLVDRAFAFLDAWEVAIPLHDYGDTADCYGAAADRELTRAAIGETRLMLYNPHVIFARRCEAAAALLEAFAVEPGDRHHALLRAIYQTKPLILALPVEWAGGAPGRGMDDMIRVRNARVPSGRAVTVQVGPNKFKKMDRQEAIDKGFLPGGNKMAAPAGNKAAADVVATEQIGTEQKVSVQAAVVEATEEAFDFASIPGVGPATNRLLHSRGVLTLEAAKQSPLEFLPRRMIDLIHGYEEPADEGQAE